MAARYGIWIVAVAGIALLAITFAGGKAQRSGLLRPGDAAIVARGEAIYANQCAACHGANLEGEPDWQSPKADGAMPAPPHDETGHTWHHPDRLLFDITKYGIAKVANLEDYTSAMPVYEESLSDDDIVAVLSFIKSTWPDEMREGHDAMNARYEENQQ